MQGQVLVLCHTNFSTFRGHVKTSRPETSDVVHRVDERQDRQRGGRVALTKPGSLVVLIVPLHRELGLL